MATTTNRSSGAIGVIGIMFFVFGFATWLNGPLITFVKLAFQLSDVGAFLVPMAFYLSYVFLALPSAAAIRIIGFRKGMAGGLVIMSAGMALFGEFATLRLYPGALAGLFVVGAGLALLQTAANPYVSVLGPADRAAQRIALMGVCNKAAGILAPLVIGALILHHTGDLGARMALAHGPAERDAVLRGFASSIRLPYFAMALLLLGLAVFVLRSALPEPAALADAQPRDDARGLSAPHLWLGVLCLFLYVGVEVMSGDAIGTYGQALGLPIGRTAFFTSFTLAAMLGGYVAGMLLVPRFVSQENYLALSAVAGILLSLAAALTGGYVSVGCIACLGFANAMMWPAIFPLGIRRLGPSTALGSAFMIMGISGGALVPQLFVQLKQHYDFRAVFACLMVASYLYILFYARLGHKAGLHGLTESGIE